MSQNARIGDLLVNKKVITADQLEKALKEQRELGKKLGNLLVSSGAIDEKTFLQYLAQQVNMPYIDLAHYAIDEEFSRQLAESHARHFQAILLAEEKDHYVVGMVDPLDIFATDELYSILKKPLKLSLVGAKELLYTLDQIYRRTGEITDFVGKLSSELKLLPRDKEEAAALKHAEPAVIKLLNSVFEDAVQVGASDIHIEPAENLLRIRLRVDGMLQEQVIPLTDRHTAPALAQRIKLMAGLNIAEKRLPQDGRFDITVRNLPLDVRLSVMPTQYGESIVMRILSKDSNILGLDATGMPPAMLARFRELIKVPYGIILVTGPTGSGKTTTLYSALSEINDVTKNIITIEDPIEYKLERANQIQVNTQVGLTFAKVLRSALRQDPNVLLVGEIRDQETASIALRAALTGHLVFATLHTNDAASAPTRLVDIGVEKYLVAATVRAILAQRLARRICPNCIAPYKPNEQEVSFFETVLGDTFTPNGFNHGAGCTHCNFTGFKGRIGIFELLEFDAQMREALRTQNTNEFAQSVGRDRASNLLFNAFELAQQGMITLSEVMRVTGEQF